MNMFEKDKILVGMTVRSSDGDKLGKVAAIDNDGLVVEKGIFFPKDYRASLDHVSSVSGDDVYLKFGTDLIEVEYDRVYGAGTYATETADESRWADYQRAGQEREQGREHMSVPLKEEEVDVRKRGLQERGRVRIIKTVRTDEEKFTVPLRREEVRVERVPAESSEAGVSGEFKEETVTIPIREEEVEIKKRPVVKEELRVKKEEETFEKPVHEEVRKEEARIERDEPKKKVG